MWRVKNLFHPMLRRALKALDNEKRQLILSYIIEEGPASPSDMAKALGMRDNKLAYHIRQLVIGNIIEGKVRRGKVIYRLKPFGIDLLNNIFKALIPPSLRTPSEKRHKLIKDYEFELPRFEIDWEAIERKMLAYQDIKANEPLTLHLEEAMIYEH